MSPVVDNPVSVPDRELEEDKKAFEPEPPRIRCPLCGCRPARKTYGLAPAGMNGTPSTREASAPLASTDGLKLNASRVLAGRRIRSGTPSDIPHLHVSRPLCAC
jgi:hypothetical protein